MNNAIYTVTFIQNRFSAQGDPVKQQKKRFLGLDRRKVRRLTVGGSSCTRGWIDISG